MLQETARGGKESFASHEIGKARIYHANCLGWLTTIPENSIHAVVTDPPFGMREYTEDEIHKLRAGRGGVWRIPPSFDGSNRSPLPRFTILTEEDIHSIRDFYLEWGRLISRALTPGGHLLIAGNPLINHVVYSTLSEAGLEKRGEIIRLVRTFRGGDRPKGAEEEYRELSTMPRACFEPWGLFRKPFTGKVSDNLLIWKTGALRRPKTDLPVEDVVESGRTPKNERAICNHPSLKPQDFMRQIVRAALPLGTGVVLDPFMGGGSTIAAAEALGYNSIGIEIDKKYYNLAKEAIPRLARIKCGAEQRTLI